MATFSIGQIASRAELNSSTIRYYESIGLMPEPERINGQRRYSEDVLDRIRFIKTAQAAGFSIPEITVLLEGFEPHISPSDRWKELAKEKCEELEEKKKQLDNMLQVLENGLKCKCLTWSECFVKMNSDGTCC
ncbi:MerR family transcriptional regulator [Brevibacillus centrosporus]|uniref:MerR family transcriptional regulator n=1 Tax=Brevibacillus centrosporus TaxID=54910 RepID=UPI0011442BC7|nr:MerR family transcriptional regulator [Brevibacillus centrosporus]MEC2130031.1 MerR family transcriptional regulator [Brevibacillus centrosporus]GED32414.1 MerR family transcriptional regulator [Brevibacillus centrosporus]